MYSKNILNFITHFAKEGNFELNLKDEIIKGALITNNGEVVNSKVKELIK